MQEVIGEWPFLFSFLQTLDSNYECLHHKSTQQPIFTGESLNLVNQNIFTLFFSLCYHITLVKESM